MSEAAATHSTRHDLRWLVVALLPWVVVEVAHWGWPIAAEQGDYAQYLLHARALVEGRGYADTGYLFHPDAWAEGPLTYPPGLSLLLAPLVALWGTDSLSVRAFVLLTVGGFATIAFLTLRRWVAPGFAAAGVASTLLALEAAGATRSPLSDVGFAVLVWGTWLLSCSRDRWNVAGYAGLAALVAGAVAFRLAGVALLPAVGMWLVLEHRHRGWRLWVPLLAAGVLVALVVGWRVARSDLDNIVGSARSLGNWVTFVVPFYGTGVSEAMTYPFGANRLDDAWHAAGLLAAVVGAWHHRALFGSGTLGWTIVSYATMLLVVRVADMRYIWPFFPMVLALAGSGFAVLLGRVGERAARAVPLGLVLGAIVVATLHSLRREPPAFSYATSDARALFAELQHQRYLGARLMAPNPRVFALQSRRAAMAPLARTAHGQVDGWREQGITHVIVQDDTRSRCTQRIVNRLPALLPGALVPVWGNASFRIYRVAELPVTGTDWTRISIGRIEEWCMEHMPAATVAFPEDALPLR